MLFPLNQPFWKKSSKPPFQIRPNLDPFRKTSAATKSAVSAGSSNHLRNLRRRIEALEDQQLTQSAQRRHVAYIAWDSVSQNEIEALIGAFGAERKGRPLTPEEASAKEAYKKQLNHVGRYPEYYNVETFDDADVFDPETFDLQRAILRAVQISKDERQLAREAAHAFEENRAATPEETAAVAKWNAEWRRVARLAGVRILEVHGQFAIPNERQLIVRNAIYSLDLDQMEPLLGAFAACRSGRPLTPQEAGAKQAFHNKLNETCAEHPGIDGFADQEIFDLDAFNEKQAIDRVIRYRFSERDRHLNGKAELALQSGQVPTPEESAAHEKVMPEINRLVCLAYRADAKSQEDQAQ